MLWSVGFQSTTTGDEEDELIKQHMNIRGGGIPPGHHHLTIRVHTGRDGRLMGG